ncbi:unnamed protein product, partial [Hymenolepis diminuta]
LTAFVIGVLRIHLEKVGRHKHSRIAYIALLSSGSLSLLIGLVIWSDVGTHATKELIDQWRIGILRKYFGQLNKNVYENRTALVHVIAN